jgi:hypothetical protein
MLHLGDLERPARESQQLDPPRVLCPCACERLYRRIATEPGSLAILFV